MSDELKGIITPPFRISFPHVFKPKSFQEREPMYSVQMLFPKNTDLKALKAAAAAVAKKKWKDDMPTALKSPFKDGDTKKYENSKGMIIVEAKSKQKPGVVNQNLEPIIDPSEFQPGYWARASVTPFAYDRNGNRGISFALNNIQLIKKDVPFTGRKDPKEEFEIIEGYDGGDDETTETNEDLAAMF